MSCCDNAASRPQLALAADLWLPPCGESGANFTAGQMEPQIQFCFADMGLCWSRLIAPRIQLVLILKIKTGSKIPAKLDLSW